VGRAEHQGRDEHARIRNGCPSYFGIDRAEISHKEAQRAQISRTVCAFCASLWHKRLEGRTPMHRQSIIFGALLLIVLTAIIATGMQLVGDRWV
jgi:hypothetical protein